MQTPLQSEYPGEQLSTHLPAVQTSPALQRLPQAPQFWGSDWVLAQALAQVLSPVGHFKTHAPATQAIPTAHSLPQVPQLLLSVAVLTQIPLQLV